MVTIVNTGLALTGKPIAYHPQTGSLITNKFEVVKPDNTTFRPYTRRATTPTPDLSIPSRIWVLSPQETSEYSHIIIYDLENMQEIRKTDTDNNLELSRDATAAIMVFTKWGEKYYLLPLNPKSGHVSIWGYSTLNYSRINTYWKYRALYKYSWEYGTNPGFNWIVASAIKNNNVYLIGNAVYVGNDYITILKAKLIHYLGFGSWWSYMFEKIFTAPRAIDTISGVVWNPVMFFDGDVLYHTYVKDTGSAYELVLRIVKSDGNVQEVSVYEYPQKYTIMCDWRRIAKNKVLLAVYYGDVSAGEGSYGAPPLHLQLFVINLNTLSVTDLSNVATSTNGGNAYAFLDNSNVLHRIQLAEEYIIKLYRESQTRIKVVTTKLDGTPVSLMLNVYKCDGWMDMYRGGNRKELIGTVTTGSDGIGYFEYDGELALLHFEWARDDEGYAYNYIVAGKPKYRALKYGEEDWYV